MSERSNQSQEATNRRNVLLIDSHTMTRECLSHVLATVPGFCLRSSGVVDGLDEDLGGWSPAVVVLNIHSQRIDDPQVALDTKRIRHVFLGIPTALISDCCDISLAYLAIQQGHFGYITTSMPPDLVVSAIQLILAGGTFVERELVLRSIFSDVLPDVLVPAKVVSSAQANITRREWQVLNLLRQGKQNKVIAHELRISERTVKLHVHHMMRKLSATNRTHVAALGADMHPAIYGSDSPSAGTPDI